MGSRYGAAHNPSADHGVDVEHAVATGYTEASVMAQTDNQYQMVAHRMMENTQSEVEECEVHPPFE